MKVHVLGSGSEGNAIVIESGRQRLMVDAGFGMRELARRMKLVDVQPDTVTGLIVTHEHHDHVRGAGAAARRWSWPVYGTAGTFDGGGRRKVADGGRPRAETSMPVAVAVEPSSPRAGRRRRIVKQVVDTHREVILDDFAVRFIRAPHDAREPVALVATVRSTGERVGIAYDIGHISERFMRHFTDVDILLLESNHDSRMLMTGPYPWTLKQRVAGPNGHISNDEAGLMARACAHRGLRHIVLCHLSKVNNRPDIAIRAMKGALRGSAFRGTLQAAPQDQPITLGERAQFELAL